MYLKHKTGQFSLQDFRESNLSQFLAHSFADSSSSPTVDPLDTPEFPRGRTRARRRQASGSALASSPCAVRWWRGRRRARAAVRSSRGAPSAACAPRSCSTGARSSTRRYYASRSSRVSGRPSSRTTTHCSRRKKIGWSVEADGRDTYSLWVHYSPSTHQGHR